VAKRFDLYRPSPKWLRKWMSRRRSRIRPVTDRRILGLPRPRSPRCGSERAAYFPRSNSTEKSMAAETDLGVDSVLSATVTLGFARRCETYRSLTREINELEEPSRLPRSEQQVLARRRRIDLILERDQHAQICLICRGIEDGLQEAG